MVKLQWSIVDSGIFLQNSEKKQHIQYMAKLDDANQISERRKGLTPEILAARLVVDAQDQSVIAMLEAAIITIETAESLDEINLAGDFGGGP